jgi:hypothetical protein
MNRFDCSGVSSSVKIAFTGHTGSHAPQSIHVRTLEALEDPEREFWWEGKVPVQVQRQARGMDRDDTGEAVEHDSTPADLAAEVLDRGDYVRIHYSWF